VSRSGAPICRATPAAIERAAELLRGGGVVGFPTETVYGLGAHAMNGRSVARVFEIKGRPRFDPLIVHVPQFESVRALADDVPPLAERLARRFWPGPLTLVLPKRPAVPDIVTAGLATVAVRCPDHPVAADLLRRAGIPVAAPSANRFGGLSPTTAEAVAEQLGDGPDLILDGGPCPVGLESTILAIEDNVAVLLRPGGLALEEIEADIGFVRTAPAVDARPLAPGRLARHYAPRTPLTLLSDTPPSASAARRSGWVGLRPPPDAARYAAVEPLSPSGDLREAAAQLFAALRRLDALGLERIFAEPVPAVGLGRAINDRLRRAAAGGGARPG